MKFRRHGDAPTAASRSLAWAALALLVAVVPAFQGCLPMVVAAGVGAGALVATDRRSTGAQVDDETIEVKITTGINNRWGDKVHVNVTSYNAVVLLTGEVPDAKVRNDVLTLANTTDRVHSVQNEIVVAVPTDMSQRTNDSYITSKVKARFVEANKFSATHVKVVTERGVVYLMGLVNRSEAASAAQIAATTTGVTRVVKVFEYIN